MSGNANRTYFDLIADFAGNQRQRRGIDTQCIVVPIDDPDPRTRSGVSTGNDFNERSFGDRKPLGGRTRQLDHAPITVQKFSVHELQ